MSKITNVFISHIHEDDAQLAQMKALLESHGRTIKDSSVSADKPNEATSEEYIKSKILAPRINWAGAMVVLITPETKNSSWVDWEIEYAKKHDKRVVGVWASGDKGCDVPEALKDYADAVVGWHADQIIGAIDGVINNWQNPDGTLREEQPIRRFTC